MTLLTRWAFIALMSLLLCYSSAQAQTTFIVGGSLSGLAAGKSVVLLKNSTSPLILTSNGGFSFSTGQASGSYSVTVGIQPSGQLCTVTNGTGTITNANVNNIAVTCVNTYTVSGTVSGLTSSSVVLRMNSSSLIFAGGATAFKFSSGLTNGSAYAVSVGIQPTGLNCTVSNGVGLINLANVTNVSISCAATYTVSGTISGLTSSGLVLKLKAANLLIPSGATSFKFSTGLQSGVTYLVGVNAQPQNQVCLVANGSGVIGTSNITNVVVTCTAVTVPDAPTIGNAITGDGFATVNFTAPVSNGGSVVTGYTLSCTSGSTTRTATGASSPITITGLTNLTAYSCSVTATNAVGTSPASVSISVTPYVGTANTASVLCPYSQSTPNITLTTGVTATSNSSWTCSGTLRSLTANGIPDHQIGTFPNPGNPNAPTAQTINASAPLTPVVAASNTALRLGFGYALNGVKFDPGTGGTCPSTATKSSDCSAIGTDPWKLEALGVAKSFFNFGTDSNNAHVQPTGAYHYHGMPEGILTKMGVTSANPTMALIGWAPDGYPVYARYGHTIPTDISSPLKVIQSSWRIQLTPDTGRPLTTYIPMGVFLQDYEYIAGLGDLDDCNGRFDVTPEFPNGIYHYYATDNFPYFPRCWKGVVN
jgi:hypothetical protein